MRFSVFSASAVLALASAVVGQEFFDSITSPTRDQVIPAGVPFDIIWVPEKVEGTIKITLLQGPTNTTLATGPVIASRLPKILQLLDIRLILYSWSNKPRWKILLEANR